MRSLSWVLLLLAAAQGGCDSSPAPSDAATDAPEAGASSASVLQYHNSASRSGLYIDPALTLATVPSTTLDSSFNATVSGNTYAQPLFFDAQGAGKDLVFVATEQNQVTAFDASDGTVVWQTIVGTPVDFNALVASGQVESSCGTIKPTLGITGTGVIDPASRTLYLDAMVTAATTPNLVVKHVIFALSIDDGTTKSGWPFDVSTISTPFAFDSARAIQRGGLALVGGTLYVPFGSHASCYAPHGWVVAVPTANPAAATAWATLSPGGGGGVWAPGGVTTDGASLYVATSYFDSTVPAQWTDADCLGVLRLGLGPSFSGATTDYWAPTDWTQGGDPASSAPVPFDLPGATPSQLLLAFDRLSGHVAILDRANLGGVGAALVDQQVGVGENGGGDILTAPAVYTTSQGTYAVFNGASSTCNGDLSAIKIVPGSPPTVSTAWCAYIHGHGLPIVSTSDGTNDAVVWAVGTEDSGGAPSDNKLHALDGDTGQLLYSSPAMAPTERYITPIVAKGHVLVGGKNQLYSFAVPAN